MVFNELAEFIQGLGAVLAADADALKYWHQSNDLKEHFRHLIRYGIKGGEKAYPSGRSLNS